MTPAASHGANFKCKYLVANSWCKQLVQAWHCNCVVLHLYDIATVLSHRTIGGLVLHLYDIATVLPHRAIGGLVHHLYDIATVLQHRAIGRLVCSCMTFTCMTLQLCCHIGKSGGRSGLV